MDNIFLTEITKSYLNDNQLDKKNFDRLESYLLEIRNCIREDPLIYEFIGNESYLYKQRICYRLLDDYIINENIVTEDFGIVSGTILAGLSIAVGALLGLYGRKIINFSYERTIAGISKLKQSLVTNKQFDSVRSQVKRHEVVFKVLDEEYSNCAKKCGIDTKRPELYLAQTKNPLTSDYKHLGDIHCAVTCTLDYMTSSFAELNKAYRTCLEKTGETVNQDLDPKYSIPVGAHCQDVRSEMDDIYKNFTKMVENLYYDDPQVKSMWINIMNKKVKDSLSGKSVKSYNPRTAEHNLKSDYFTYD
jgi:hypothetical protein